MSHSDQDTIAAIATAPGKGGVGIVRLSGANALSIADQICHKPLKPRTAGYRIFSDKTNKIDEGIALYFPGPNSFTGEDVVELQGHGGPVILNLLVNACIEYGARPARPGEFSERAFLNDRMDLAQAEAIADLIDAGTETAARAASRSLEGVFSQRINELQKQLTELRVFVEAAIDFPEEEIDFLQDEELKRRIDLLHQLLQETSLEAKRGALINEGAKIAIIGRPNAGKSSLMNALARRDIAIVTDIAGTTRDSIEQQVELCGVPITLVDTAGLNDTPDQVERIGIERSRAQAEDADLLLVVIDSAETTVLTEQSIKEILGEFSDILGNDKPIVYVANKIDLSQLNAGLQPGESNLVGISATTGAGVDSLLQCLQNTLELGSEEPAFSARSRHLAALKQSSTGFSEAVEKFELHSSGELFAEDLRAVQQALSEITGSLSADDLLGEIFSNFCIGK